jgi:hypothetical protein
MPIKDLVGRSEQLSKLVDSLSRDEWRETSDAMLFGMDLGNGKAELKMADLHSDMSPRLASMMMRRLKTGSQKVVWKRYLLDYDGEDGNVWQVCSRLALGEVRSRARSWPEALRVMRRSYEKGFIYHFYEGSHLNSDVPIDVARGICESPNLYPVGLVGAASVALTTATGSSAVPVAKVAAHGEWFVQ